MALLIAAGRCSDAKGAREVLEWAQLREIHITGWDPRVCGWHWYHTGFSAIDLGGDRIEGAVCRHRFGDDSIIVVRRTTPAEQVK